MILRPATRTIPGTMGSGTPYGPAADGVSLSRSTGIGRDDGAAVIEGPPRIAAGQRAGYPTPGLYGEAALRIAMVAAGRGMLGGHSVQARLLCDHLRAGGHGVTFIPINPGFPTGLGWTRLYPYVRTLVNQAFYVPSLMRLSNVDVVHIFAASYWSFLLAPTPALVMARMLRKRTILHYHSGEAEDHLSGWGRLVHPWLRLAHEIVVPSGYLRDVFARYGYRTRVIPNLIDLARFRYRERHPIRPRLLSNRNLEEHYRVHGTLIAFALFRTRYPRATLTIAGSGSRIRDLHRLADALGNRGIRFVGAVPPENMPALYDDADLFINSSVVDNQPVSILEAFAAGLPVVSTAVGDIPNMLRGGACGALAPPGDPPAMARALTALMENPVRAQQLAREARIEVERYTWPHIRDEWTTVYSRTEGER